MSFAVHHNKLLAYDQNMYAQTSNIKKELNNIKSNNQSTQTKCDYLKILTFLCLKLSKIYIGLKYVTKIVLKLANIAKTNFWQNHKTKSSRPRL